MTWTLAIAMLLVGAACDPQIAIRTAELPDATVVEAGAADAATADAGAAPAPEAAPAARASIESIEPSRLRRYLRKKLPELSDCHAKQRTVGAVTAQLVLEVDGAGVAQSANVTGLGNRDAERCMAAALAGYRFPKPAGGKRMRVSARVSFKPPRSE